MSSFCAALTRLPLGMERSCRGKCIFERNQSGKKIYLYYNAYLIIDNEMMTALCLASKKGN